MAKIRRANPEDSPASEAGLSDAGDDSPEMRSEPVQDLEEVLAIVSQFLNWGSQQPLSDAEEIIKRVDEIRSAHVLPEPRASQARTESSQMIKDEARKATMTDLTADFPRLSPELNRLLIAVVDNPKAWLSTPSSQLDDRPPNDLVGTDEEYKIFDILHAVDQGLF